MSASNVPRGASPRLPERIVVVRLSAMGDIIHSLPAATALRNAFPTAFIGWVVEERWAELLCTPQTARFGPRSEQRPLADHVHTVNTKRWRDRFWSPSTAKRILAIRSELGGMGYQIAIDLQGAVRSAVIAAFSRAEIYGAAIPRETLAKHFYAHSVQVTGTHIAEQNLSIVASLCGGSATLPQVIFPVDATADEHWDAFLMKKRIGRFVLLNPGAGWGAKQWPAIRYGQVAKELARDGLASLVNFGPGEKAIADSVVIASEGNAIPISCSITQLVSLTRRASLFIGGDTGPAHLADALHIPVIGIYGPTNPARNGPIGNHHVVLRSPISSTDHARRPQPEAGLLQITVDRVVTAARQLMGNALG